MLSNLSISGSDGTAIVSNEGVRATVRLIEELLRVHRFVEASCLIRETLLNLWILAGDQPTDFEKRSRQDGSMKNFALHDKEPDYPLTDIARRAATRNGKFADSRNDAAHCGFRENALERDKMVQELNAELAELNAMVRATSSE